MGSQRVRHNLATNTFHLVRYLNYYSCDEKLLEHFKQGSNLIKVRFGKVVSGLPWWLSGKNLPAHSEDAGSIPRMGRSPGGGNGNTLQYSCLGNAMDGGAW